MVTKVSNLDYLVNKDLQRLSLTTRDIGKILQFSRQHVIRLCDSDLLEHFHIPLSKHRKIRIETLVHFVQRDLADLKTAYPQQQLLHFMEVAGLKPEKYGLKGLAGRDGLRFHVQETLYSTVEVAVLMKSNYNTIKRCLGNGTLDGYRLPGSEFWRVLASGVARYVRDNKIPLREGCEIAPSPEIITYPDPYLGYGRDTGEWINGTKVVETTDNQSVWYRSGEGLHEVSIRRGECYGLYFRLIGLNEPKPRIDLILLVDASKTLEGRILPREEHLKRVYELLKIGAGLSIDKCSIALNRLLEVYPELKEKKS